jgi:hypothetical protein
MQADGRFRGPFAVVDQPAEPRCPSESTLRHPTPGKKYDSFASPRYASPREVGSRAPSASAAASPVHAWSTYPTPCFGPSCPGPSPPAPQPASGPARSPGSRAAREVPHSIGRHMQLAALLLLMPVIAGTPPALHRGTQRPAVHNRDTRIPRIARGQSQQLSEVMGHRLEGPGLDPPLCLLEPASRVEDRSGDTDTAFPRARYSGRR